MYKLAVAYLTPGQARPTQRGNPAEGPLEEPATSSADLGNLSTMTPLNPWSGNGQDAAVVTVAPGSSLPSPRASLLWVLTHGGRGHGFSTRET